MIVEPRGGFECVDIEGMRLKTGNRGLGEATAKSEDEPVIGQELRCAINRASDLSFGGIDIRDLRDDVLDADRVKHIGERYKRRIEVGFVIADADRMPCGPVHDKNLDLIGAGAKLIQPAGGRHGAPETSETGAKHENAVHPVPPLFSGHVRDSRRGQHQPRGSIWSTRLIHPTYVC